MRSAWIIGAVAGAAYVVLATRPAQVCVASVSEADPEDLLNLVAQVEREPEFIPTVESVTVEAREGDAVRYRVDVRAAGAPGWARFRKQVNAYEGIAEWTTLDGILGFRQTGLLVSEREAGRTVTSVQTETSFCLPLVGPALAHLSSLFLAPVFLAWLKNLEAAAEKSSDEPISSR